jgi:CHAT domain-containing protein/tetratricopeptide (TPR) repeat protein
MKIRWVTRIVLTLFASATSALPAQTSADSAALLDSLGMKAYDEGTQDGRDRAIRLWSDAMAHFQRARDRSGEAKTLHNIGLAFNGQYAFDSALVYYRKALPVFREVGNGTGEATTFMNIGHVHNSAGRRDSALTYFAQAVPIWRRVGNRSREAITLNNIGVLHNGLGRPDSALAYHLRALPVQREVSDSAGEAMTLGNIGFTHYGVGRSDSALAYYSQVLVLWRALRNGMGEATALNNIGSVYLNVGRPDSALVYYMKALPIRREVGDRTGEAATLHNLGVVHSRLGRADSALAYYMQALPVAQSVRNKASEARTLANIGDVHRSVGRLDSALVYYRRALPVLREWGDRAAEGSTLHNIAVAHRELGRPDSALVYYSQALAIQRAVRNRSTEAVTLGNMASLFQHHLPRREISTAVAYYDSAAAVLATIAGHAGGDQNRLSFAEQGFSVSVFRQWALAWLALRDTVGQESSSLAALVAVERGRARSLLDFMRRATPQLQVTRNQGTDVALPGGDLVVEGKALVQTLMRNAGALSYLITPDTLLVWFVAPSGAIEVFRTAVNEQRLASEVAAIRAGLGADSAAVRARVSLRAMPDLEPHEPVSISAESRTNYERALASLSRLLLPPDLLSRLRAGSELVIVPHGVLNLLPFAALEIDTPGRPLGITYSLRYTPALATLAQLSQGSRRTGEQSTGSSLIVGNPAMPSVPSGMGSAIILGDLPGAEAEAQWVAERVGSPLVRGVAATEAEIKLRLPNASLVHMATHGYAYSSEARAPDSFIALAPTPGEDGLLTVAEVLNAVPSLSAELVVLSACQTGLGNLKHAEGTVGLQRAFLAKGARSVLVSLWSVSDEATELLMKGFYRHWLGGSTKAEALRRAQMEVRGAPGSRFHSPIFWAAFQLVGAP